MTGSIWAVVPAAGSGRRIASEVPKQYLKVNGIPILEYTLRALLACSDIRGVVVVVDPADRRADSVVSLSDPRVFTTSGGAERADSVLSGLHAVSDYASDDDWVLVHDAARPCISVGVLTSLITSCMEAGVGTVLAQASTDTLKRASGDGRVLETLDRRTVWRAQTPQIFRLTQLQSALGQALADAVPITDESMAMELAGHPVALVEGPSTNIKVTLPADLEFAAIILRHMAEAGEA